MNKLTLILSSAILGITATVGAQDTQSMASAVRLGNSYRVIPNISYLKTEGFDSKLDVYESRSSTTPQPTLIFIHGGNWVGGSKEASSMSLLPFLAMGWNVVNIDYRLVQVAPAPAAVEDCRCALRWVYQHATEHNIDTKRLVLSGNSAGGHLALLTGMIHADDGLDGRCAGADDLKVAGIINWYGFPNLTELMAGANARPAVATWIGAGTARLELARRLSPINYVRAGAPPVLTIQGDADPVSPYEYATQFRDALSEAGVPSTLLTIPQGKHGGFTDAETIRIYSAVQDFFEKAGISSRSSHQD